MEDYSRTLIEFKERFVTDDDCLRYLASLRWPDGPAAPDEGIVKHRRQNLDFINVENADTIIR